VKALLDVRVGTDRGWERDANSAVDGAHFVVSQASGSLRLVVAIQ
jgi:hypothetical protein